MSRVAGDPAGKHSVRGPDGRFRPVEPAGEPADEPAGKPPAPVEPPVPAPDTPEHRGPLSRVLTRSLGDWVRPRG